MKKLLAVVAAAIAVASGAFAATIDLFGVVSDLTLANGDIVTGTLGGNCKISIEDGATVSFSDVTIIADKEDDDFDNCTWAGVTCLGDATIVLDGDNEICGFAATYPGIYVPEGKTLTIEGDGTLSATSNDSAAGIGGGEKLPCGNIVIDGGTIEAVGMRSPGIGGGYWAACGNIVINGGTVTSIGGDSSAGIGSTYEGECGNITVNGGVVTASGGSGSAGIGSAYYGSCGVVTICGGNVTATGGEYAAGIGSGAEGSCSGVQISVGDGYPRVVATCGDNCNPPAPLGAGNGGNCGPCSVDSSLSCVTNDTTLTIESVVDLSSIADNITVSNGQFVAGTLGVRREVTIADGATVVLRNVSINANGASVNSPQYAGLTCEGDATIILEGYSTVKSFNEYCPGIYVPSGCTLTIQGDGNSSLESSGGKFAAGIGGGAYVSRGGGNIVIDVEEGCRISANGGLYGGAGIGSGVNVDCGDITIYGGTIEALGGGAAAGIGGGNDGDCGDIAIYGGVVKAIGGDSGAGIGGGNPGEYQYWSGDITIEGGTIAATGGVYAAGIGTGDGHYNDACCGWIAINGGTVSAAGGSNAAGIGTGREGACEGGIEINGGEITATGGDYGAGIGSGDGKDYDADCGSIVINGGAVYATGGSGAAGIGMGWKGTCDCVKINLGISCVDATCGYGCMTPISAGDEGECDDDSVEVASCLTDELSQDGKERIIECGEGYAAWVVEVGLSGDDADLDATPDIWGGWENAFVYLYGEDIVDGYATLIDISIDEDGKPVITTAPEEWREDVTATVVGSSSLSDWSNPVILEQDGDEWTLPTGAKANFFRLILTYSPE